LGRAECACSVGEWLKADRKSCGSFGPIQPVSTAGSTQPMQPQFAFDREGNGLAVWTQSDYQSTSLWTRRYVSGSGWVADATKLALANPGAPSSPRLALGGVSGRGVIAWVQTTSTSRSIWAVGYMGLSFDAPRQIDGGGAGDASEPSVVLDDNGDGIAAWTQSDGTHSRIWTNRLSTATGWLGAQPVESTADDDAFGGRLALDSQANASLVWTQYHLSPTESPRSSPWSAQFDAAFGRWSSPSQLDDSGVAAFPDIRPSGANTNAIAAWARTTDGVVSIHASTRLPAGWSDSTSLAVGGSDIRSAMPRVVLSPSRSGAAIWTQFQVATYQVWGNSYDGSVDRWTAAAPLSSAECTAGPTPQLETDPSGEGFGVWSEIIGTSRVIRASRIQKGVGFRDAFTLSMDTTALPPQNSPVQIAVDSNGNAVAIWDVYQAGQYNVWSKSFE
jgi:hypothetical protein